MPTPSGPPNERSLRPSSRIVVSAVLCVAAAAACTSQAPASATAPRAPAPVAPITRAQIEVAQATWCDALVRIGQVSAAGGDARAVAAEVLSSAYGYDHGPTLFKPTLTHGAQTFRLTKAGALAYFVGGDPAYPDDDGFARKQWVRCTPEIAGVVVSGDMALAMGNVHLQDAKGTKVTVDKTFGYQRDDRGVLRIVLHHSSLPYQPGS